MIPGLEVLPYLYNSDNPETKVEISRVDTAPRGVETPILLLIGDSLGLMEPARGESFPSGQRRGPAAPGEHRVSSPDQKSFHTSTTPTTRGRKRRSPGSIPLRTVWKPQPHLLIADWLGLMKPARGKRREWPNGTTSRFRRTRGAKFPIPGSEILPYLYYSNNLGTKTVIPGSIPPRAVWKPQPYWLTG